MSACVLNMSQGCLSRSIDFSYVTPIMLLFFIFIIYVAIKYNYNHIFKHFSFSGTKLSDYLKTHSLNSDDAFIKNEDRIFKEIQYISDDESDKSFSELINDYKSRRSQILTDSNSNLKKDQMTASDDDSFEKIDMEDVLSLNKSTLDLMDQPLQYCAVVDLMTKSQKPLSQNTGRADQDIVKQKYTKRKLKEIDKTPDNIPDSIKAERSLSQVSSLDLEEFDESLVLPQDTITKWAVQLLLSLEKLHTLGIICR